MRAGGGAGDITQRSNIFPGGPHLILMHGTQFYLLDQGSAKVTSEEPDRKHFRLCGNKAPVSTAQICPRVKVATVSAQKQHRQGTAM